jgi:antitoxin (DNA-binding transcriptional repressor) of toxin-antitoxin stability system
MIEYMSTVRMNENDVAANFADVLEKVRRGVEVIVEKNHQPVAIIQAPKRSGRLISECIALAKAYEEKLGYRPIPDPDFAKDVEDGIRERSQPFNPPSWD